MRWSKGANGGGLESEIQMKKKFVENRQNETEEETSVPRNKVDQNSSQCLIICPASRAD